ncbi:MAG: hypothetical protein ACXAD7_03180 [Candidatus Kariarchaeaceae archaeon]
MSQYTDRSKLAIFSVVIASLGIIVAALKFVDIGLTFIFISALLMAGSFVNSRLKKMGAEAWALGSLFVWIGYFLFAFPVLGFAWGILVSIRIYLFVSGIVLIILGFTTEYYDLNVKFLRFLERTKKRFLDVLSTIRATFFHSIWTGLATLDIIYLSLSFIIVELLSPFETVNISNTITQRIILVIFALCFLIVEFRALIILGIGVIIQFFVIITNSILRRLTQLPSLVKRIYELFVDLLRSIWNFIIQNIIFLTYNTYLIGFTASIITLIIAISKQDNTIFAVTILLIIVSLATLLLQRSDQVAERIGQFQQAAYRRATVARRLITRVSSNECPNCGQLLTSNQVQCYTCKNFIPKCSVCKGSIFSGSEILECNHCQEKGHAEHLLRWVQIKPICPHCRREWK